MAVNPVTDPSVSISDLFTKVSEIIWDTNVPGRMTRLEDMLRHFAFAQAIGGLRGTKYGLYVWLLDAKTAPRIPAGTLIDAHYGDIRFFDDLTTEQKESMRAWYRKTFPAQVPQAGGKKRRGSRKSRKSRRKTSRRHR
jgi:hypothetical protein